MLLSASWLVVAVTAVFGVRVAVQVMPPLLLLGVDKVPLGTVTSAAVKPVMASVKVKVTVAVSPILRAVSLIVMAVARAGALTSRVTVASVLVEAALAAPPAERATVAGTAAMMVPEPVIPLTATL